MLEALGGAEINEAKKVLATAATALLHGQPKADAAAETARRAFEDHEAAETLPGVTVPAGTVVAAAIAVAGITRFRASVTGQPRAPLCGMGICMECCVTINGRPRCRSCLTLCQEGMEVRTDE